MPYLTFNKLNLSSDDRSLTSKLMKKLLFLSLFYCQLSNAQPFALNTKKQVFSQPVEFKYHPFSMIDCQSSLFEKEVKSFGILVSDKALFSAAWFKSKCSFKKSAFRSGADFSRASFTSYADFGHLTSEEYLHFDQAKFCGEYLLWMGDCIREKQKKGRKPPSH